MTSTPIYSWRTQKTATGFAFTITASTPTKTVQPNGHYAVTETVKTGNGYSSRARAKSAAVKWCRHLRAS